MFRISVSKNPREKKKKQNRSYSCLLNIFGQCADSGKQVLGGFIIELIFQDYL